MCHEVNVLFKTVPDRGGPDAADSLDIVRHFGPCTPKKLNLITKVLSDLIELKLCFLPNTIDCKCVARLLSCL